MKLIVIDMQKILMNPMLYEFEKFKENVSKLIAEARKNNVEVIYFKHDAGAGTGLSVGDAGFEIDPIVLPMEGEKVYIKKINSCFGNEEFARYLSESGEKDLMIVGLQTDFCIDSTIKSAFEKGYNVYVPEHTNSTFPNQIIDGEKVYKFYNEWVWPGAFAKCISLKEAIKLLKK